MGAQDIEAFETTEVVTVAPSEEVRAAAERMKEYGVGCLVVVEGGAVVGMLTDRDLALRIVAQPGRSGESTVREAMSAPVATVQESSSLEEVLELVRRRGIRRVPVLRGTELVGIVTLDDLLQGLAAEMEDLGKETQSMLRLAGKQGGLERLRMDLDRRLRRAGKWLRRTNWVAKDRLLGELDELRELVRSTIVGED